MKLDIISIDDLIDYDDDVITNKILNDIRIYELAKLMLYWSPVSKKCPKKYKKGNYLFLIQYLLYTIRNKKAPTHDDEQKIINQIKEKYPHII